MRPIHIRFGPEHTLQIEPVTTWSNEQLTAEQLEHVLAVLHNETDNDLARELAGLHLTERLTASRFERLDALLPGKETRQSLRAIADGSAFLDLPASDLLDLPIPDRASQDRSCREQPALRQ